MSRRTVVRIRVSPNDGSLLSAKIASFLQRNQNGNRTMTRTAFASRVRTNDVILTRAGTADELRETVEAVRPARMAGYTVIEVRDQFHTGRVLTLRNTRTVTLK